MSSATLDAIDREVYYAPLAPPVAPRDLLTFAKDCKNPPGGPFPGEYYDPDIHPGQREVVRVLSGGKFTYFVFVACVQDGKSWICIQVPMMFYTCELKEPVLYAIPDMRTAEDAWLEKIRPGLEFTESLAYHLPQRGSGSAGGSKITTVQLHDAAPIFFVGKGGKNKSAAASRTTRIVFQDEFGKIQRELAIKYDRRANSFDTRAVRVKAGTVESAKGDNLWNAYTKGTQHNLWYRCHLCGDRTRMQWANVTYDHTTDRKARESVRIACERCEETWTDEDRKRNLLTGVAVAACQSIDRDGAIQGQPSESEIYSLRWSALDSPLKSLGTLAVQHRQAVVEDEDGNSHPLREFWHDELAEPFPEIDTAENVESVTMVQRSSLSTYGLGEVDDRAVFLLALVDQQLRRYFWEVMAFDDEGRSWIVDHGQHAICAEGEMPDQALRMQHLKALLERLRMGRAKPSTGEVLRPLRLGVDVGNWIADTVKALHDDTDVVFIRGTSDWQAQRMGRSGKSVEGQRLEGWYDCRDVMTGDVAHQILWIESDTVKHEVFRALQRDVGATGAMHLPKGLAPEDELVRHLTAEQWQQGKTGKWGWAKRAGRRNDWFDDTYYGLGLARWIRDHLTHLVRPDRGGTEPLNDRDDAGGLDLSWR
jgi:phage terminase large subunit GpA-like protein